MAPREKCTHERARFHSVQRLGNLPPVELWQCPTCKSTVSADLPATAPSAVQGAKAGTLGKKHKQIAVA